MNLSDNTGMIKRVIFWQRLALAVLVISLLGVRTGLALQPEDLLRAEQAFAPSIALKTDDPATVIAQWTIADGYYMYRERFSFESATPGIRLGEPRYPAGKIKDDEFFGKMETYRNTVAIEIPIQRSPDAAETLELITISQGCADLGVCYPPQKVTLSLALPPRPAQSSSSTSPVLAPSLAQQQSGAALSLLGTPQQEPIAVADSGAALSPTPSAGGLNLLNNLDQSNTGLVGADLPQPEQAFIPTVQAVDGQLLRASWVIDPCCYMYRAQFQFRSLTPGVDLAAPQFPTGLLQHDEFYGEVEIYRDSVSVDIPLVRPAVLKEMELEIRFQGCADVGVCYPPQTQVVPVQLPADDLLSGLAASAGPAGSSGPAQGGGVGTTLNDIAQPASPSGTGYIAEQDRIAGLLAEQGFWALPAFFGFGLLLAFTPCVFPMIPILSSIIVGQGSHLTHRRAFLLSLVYVLAMSLTYTVAGVMAGLLGANIQIWFQDPWILTTFAALFVALALSMFGFYELQIPARWQTRLTELSNRQGGGYTGVAVMGLLSALIVGPCVAPPLIGVLTVIGSTGDATLGGSALFAMSLGMGAPLLAIGSSAGKLLPKAGPWMDRIKAVFGVMMLGVAIYLLERIVPEEIAMLLWAVLLIVCAVYMGALQSTSGHSGWFTLARGFGVVLLVYGVLMLVGVAAGGRDTLQPLRGVLFAGGNTTQPAHLSFRAIKTVNDLDGIIAQAGGRPVMLDFYADWCVSCKEMEKYTFSDLTVQAQLGDAILLQADVTANDAADQALLKRFQLIGPPAILFFGSDGLERPAYRVVGFMPAEEFSSHLTRVWQVSGQQLSQR